MKILQFLFVFVLGMALHTSSYTANLMDVYREALEQDAQYRSARAAYLAAQEKTTQGRAGLLPNVTLSGIRQTQKIGVAGRPEVTIESRGVTFTATQPIIRIENIIIYSQSKIEVFLKVISSENDCLYTFKA